MRALIVDDDPSIRSMLEILLALEGYDTLSAEDGLRAIELARAFRPDVIVLDVMMPGLTGFETATALEAEPALAATPIVFCTAMANVVDTWTGRDTDHVSYVTKPFETEDLLSAVQRAVERARAAA